MTEMTLYVMPENISYKINGEKGVIEKDGLEAFLEEKKFNVINVILSKPEIVFRRKRFTFTSARKIKMVLPLELEEALPEKPSSYSYNLEFSRPVKGFREINIYAVHHRVVDYWKEIAKKNGAALRFYSDSIILYNLLNRRVPVQDYIGMYYFKNYLLLNMVEKGSLTGSYSYYMGDADREKNREMIKTAISSKNLPVYFVGDESEIQEIKALSGETENVDMPISEGIEHVFYFLLRSKPYKLHNLKIKNLAAPKNLPVYGIAVMIVILLSFVLSALPYFSLPEKEREKDLIIKEMEDIFLQTCPDVTRVVDPLLQIRERISSMSGRIDAISGYPSVLASMAAVTALFPEDVEAEIESFVIAGGNINILGRVESLKALERVKDNFSASEKFGRMNVGSITFDENNRVKFNITLGITENE